ncbi:MAG TPA: hypothetical protein VKZ53_07065 [Candidatus Angelobacter sp.]|nr:hypothetical protein [Candidatus Angelobacter sp.]
MNELLSGAGYAGDQIKVFFNGLGGDFKNLFGDIGSKLDPRHRF